MLKIQLSNYILKYIKIENSHFKLLKYFTILLFVIFFFTSNKAALVSRRDYILCTKLIIFLQQKWNITGLWCYSLQTVLHYFPVIYVKLLWNNLYC